MTNTIINAAELVAMEFPEPKWAIPGLIPEGLSLLAGKAKLGKSWLCLAMGLAVASGGVALGSIPVDEGDVLYLALEDSARRLQDRLQRLLKDAEAPTRFDIARTWDRLDNGGLDQIGAWLVGHKDARLVIIDTLQRVRPSKKGGQRNLYVDDYEDLTPLKALADDHNVAIVVVHHLRKTDSDDPLDLVSGSTGLTAAADTIAVLRRQRSRADAELFITGRDLEETELAMRVDIDAGGWVLLGDAADYRRTEERQAVLELLEDLDSITALDVATSLGISIDNARHRLSRMTKAGDLRRIGPGRYAQPHEPLSYLSHRHG